MLLRTARRTFIVALSRERSRIVIYSRPSQDGRYAGSMRDGFVQPACGTLRADIPYLRSPRLLAAILINVGNQTTMWTQCSTLKINSRIHWREISASLAFGDILYSNANFHEHRETRDARYRTPRTLVTFCSNTPCCETNVKASGHVLGWLYNRV